MMFLHQKFAPRIKIMRGVDLAANTEVRNRHILYLYKFGMNGSQYTHHLLSFPSPQTGLAVTTSSSKDTLGAQRVERHGNRDH